MSIEATFTGGPQFQAFMAKWEQRAMESTRVALIAAGKASIDSVQHQFGKGAAPRSRTGQLIKSLYAEPPSLSGKGYEMRIGPTDLPYARVMELGLKKKGRSRKPHPYLAPGFREATKTFDVIFRKYWGNAPRG